MPNLSGVSAVGNPVETTVATTWHYPGQGFLVLPARTPCRTAGLEEVPGKEQRIFRQILNRDATLVLLLMGGTYRALPGDKLRARRTGGRIMIDPTQRELAAIRAAGPKAGEYIESLGRTDMALFSVEEFTTLIQVVVSAYLEAKATFDVNNTWDDIPF
ncbi:MAG: hypothetical protein HQL87_12665 [Magnetococcales bacterium]|nr:hypothetical protein [Magnetococcales bacterium]